MVSFTSLLLSFARANRRGRRRSSLGNDDLGRDCAPRHYLSWGQLLLIIVIGLALMSLLSVGPPP